MIYIRFIIYQFFLLAALIVINFYCDSYLGKPFNHVDLLAILISAPFIIINILLLSKLYKQYRMIRLRMRISLSVMAFIIAVVCLGTLDNIWFSINGEMFFS